MVNRIAEIILWPGTKACEYFGIEPDSDNGLMRMFFNFALWLSILMFLTFYLVE